MVPQRDACFLAGDAEMPLRIENRVERMDESGIAGCITLNEHAVEVMLIMFVQLAAEAENLAIIFERIDDIKVLIRSYCEASQLPQRDVWRKAILIQRLSEPLSGGGIDMNIVQRGGLVAAVKADVPFFFHVARCR